MIIYQIEDFNKEFNVNYKLIELADLANQLKIEDTIFDYHVEIGVQHQTIDNYLESKFQFIKNACIHEMIWKSTSKFSKRWEGFILMFSKTCPDNFENFTRYLKLKEFL